VAVAGIKVGDLKKYTANKLILFMFFKELHWLAECCSSSLVSIIWSSRAKFTILIDVHSSNADRAITQVRLCISQ